jgi:hypothetical protein
MFDLPTKKINEMGRSTKTDYVTLQKVAEEFLDSENGVEMDALLKLINGKKWSLRNFAKKESIKISILSDRDGTKYVFFKSK